MNVLPLIWEKRPRLIWGKKIECYRIRPKMTWHIKRTALFLSIILPSISPTTLLICHRILLWCQRELLNENEKKSSRSDNHFTPLLKKMINQFSGNMEGLGCCTAQIQHFLYVTHKYNIFPQTLCWFICFNNLKFESPEPYNSNLFLRETEWQL